MYSFLIDTDSNPGILLINNLSSLSKNPAGGKALVNTDRCNRSDKMSETVGRSLNPVAATEDDVHVSKDFREEEDPNPNVPMLNELAAAAADCVAGLADEPKLNELAAAAADCVAGWADEPKLKELAAAAADGREGWGEDVDAATGDDEHGTRTWPAYSGGMLAEADIHPLGPTIRSRHVGSSRAKEHRTTLPLIIRSPEAMTFVATDDETNVIMAASAHLFS
jgi:hypothetical protein